MFGGSVRDCLGSEPHLRAAPTYLGSPPSPPCSPHPSGSWLEENKRKGLGWAQRWGELWAMGLSIAPAAGTCPGTAASLRCRGDPTVRSLLLRVEGSWQVESLGARFPIKNHTCPSSDKEVRANLRDPRGNMHLLRELEARRACPASKMHGCCFCTLRHK